MEVPHDESHVQGDSYSKNHPLPTIAGFLKHKKENEELSKRQQDYKREHPDEFTRDQYNYDEQHQEQQEQPQQIQQQQQHGGASEGNTTAATATTTQPPPHYETEAVDKKEGASATSKPPHSGKKTSDVPIGDDKTNVLFHPPPDTNFDEVFKSIPETSRQISYIVGATILVVNWFLIGGGFMGLMKSLFPAGGVAAISYFVLDGIAEHASAKSIPRSVPEVDKIKYAPESVEWLNSLVDTVWQVVGIDVYKQVAQQIQDQIKTFIPTKLLAVKIADIGPGSNSVRILSMRSLPDEEFGDMVPKHGERKNMSAEENKEIEKRAAAEEGGIFYNLEIALAYHAAPKAFHKKRIHFDIVVLLGGVPLPIFVETREFVITIRIRLQMHPDLPFLKTLTFAMTEPPKVNASVALGYSGAMNLLNFPFLDKVINSQIIANTKELVQPRSMSVDMVPIIGGDIDKTETEAVGLLYIKLHRAVNLAKQDRTGGGADPYITVSFSKYEKPMYATKMIVGDRNPVWEESTCIIINADHIKRQEKVLVKLWDSDKRSADDVTGQVEVSLRELVNSEGKMFKREDQLQHEVAGGEAQGMLHWEIGYFARADWNPKLMSEETLEANGNCKTEEEKAKPSALNCRPDPDYPTGILSVGLYQCINLDVPNPNEGKKDNPLSPVSILKKRRSSSKKSAEDDDDDDYENMDGAIEEGYLPSAYVTADINDQLAIRTRVKPITRAPIYNSIVETFLIDWRNLIITIAVRDSRRKGKDPIIGAVVLKAADIFKGKSVANEWHTLTGGSGSGRVRIGVLFRSTNVQVERSFLGWAVGRFEIVDNIHVTGIKTGKIKLRTGGGQRVLRNESATDMVKVDGVVRIPVFHRYLTPLVFEFFDSPSDRKPSSYSMIWLFNLSDNETRDFNLSVYKVDKPKRYLQNVLDKIPDEEKGCVLTQSGEVTFKGRFKSGICSEFGPAVRENDDADEEDTFEVWEAMNKAGVRSDMETDTGTRHKGIVAGADMARDPEKTQLDEIKRGGTGIISDEDVRHPPEETDPQVAKNLKESS